MVIQVSLRRLIILGLLVSLGGSVVTTVLLRQPAAHAVPPASTRRPMVAAAVLPVDCQSRDTLTMEYAQVGTLGTFTVAAPDSLIKLTFQGRLAVYAFETATTGAEFELRVDGLPSTIGPARALVPNGAQGTKGLPTTLTGLFPNLPAGSHTASIWVKGLYGGGTFPGYNPNCFDTDALIIEEHVPFGSTFMPRVIK